MKVAVFNTHKFEKEYLIKANAIKHDLKLLDSYLTLEAFASSLRTMALLLFWTSSMKWG